MNRNNDRLDKPRRQGKRREKQNWLIACDGPTEERYLERLIEREQLRKYLNITIKPYRTNLNRDIFNKFIKMKYNNQNFDKYWFVFDKDFIQDNEFNYLCQVTAACGAWSNMSFELWLLLHYRAVREEADNNRLKSDLSKALGNRYEKTEDQIGEIDLGKVLNAVTFAESLEEKWQGRQDYAHHNPRTTVHRLINALFDARKQSHDS